MGEPIKREVRTTCSYCGTGCGLIVEVEDNKIIKIRGDKEAPVNHGMTCIKGAFAYGYTQAETRLTQPLVRRMGKLVPVSWDEALEEVASKLQSTKAKYGADSIGMFACARATNETNYVTQKFMRAVVENNNIDGCNRT